MTRAARMMMKQTIKINKMKNYDKIKNDEDDFPSEIILEGT